MVWLMVRVFVRFISLLARFPPLPVLLCLPAGLSDGSPQAGCIVGLGQREVQVLTTTGTVRPVPVSQLRGKLNARSHRAQALDRLGNTVSVGELRTIT